MLSTNQKGAIAEAKIVAAAVELNVPVLRPVQEHGRYDLAFEVADSILRVQCKWGALSEERDVIKVNLTSNRCTPTGYERRYYVAGEIDLVAVYCAALDRCYLLPIALVAGRRGIQLRLSPPKNGQRACLNLAVDFELPGAIAQQEERLRGTQEVAGSSPASSTPSSDGSPDVVRTGSNQFRNHFGYYLERAAAGDQIHITRHGKPFARLLPAGT